MPFCGSVMKEDKEEKEDISFSNHFLGQIRSPGHPSILLSSSCGDLHPLAACLARALGHKNTCPTHAVVIATASFPPKSASSSTMSDAVRFDVALPRCVTNQPLNHQIRTGQHPRLRSPVFRTPGLESMSRYPRFSFSVAIANFRKPQLLVIWIQAGFFY